MRNFFVALSIATLLSACGLKGPLYLSDQKPASKPPAAATPAAPTDEKKSSDTVSP